MPLPAQRHVPPFYINTQLGKVIYEGPLLNTNHTKGNHRIQMKFLQEITAE